MSRKPKTNRRRFLDPREAIAYRTVRQPNGCLRWTGAVRPQRYGDPYGVMQYNGRVQPVHRVVWELEHGPLPAGVVVDHYDCGDTLCVELTHLTTATKGENVANRRHLNANNRSGYRGVSPTPGGRYRAKVTAGYEQLMLGTFDTPEAAAVAAWRKRRELHPYLVDKSDPVEQLLANLRDSIAARLGDATGVEAIRVAEEVGRLFPWATPTDIIEALQDLDRTL